MKITQDILTEKAIELLKKLICTPSFSGEEDKTGDAIEEFLKSFGVDTKRQHNNIYAFNKYFDESKPTLLLNSHHDTVKPNSAYTKTRLMHISKTANYTVLEVMMRADVWCRFWPLLFIFMIKKG